MGSPIGQHSVTSALSALLVQSWQPALSIAAVVLSLSSFQEAPRANELAQKQFDSEQHRLREQDKAAETAARQVLIAETADNGRKLSFHILSNDVNLQQVVIDFPKETGVPSAFTDLGQASQLSIFLRSTNTPRV
jgi:hypothetical protein